MAKKLPPKKIGLSKRKSESKTIKAKYGAPDKPLIIGNIEIPCYVLEDGKRVIVQRGLFKALGINQGGATSEKYKEYGGAARLMSFLNNNSIISLISSDIGVLLKSPIVFEMQGTNYFGYEATILQEIVRAISKSYMKGNLPKRFNEIGKNAEALDDAFAKVGIIALVDEATGYQEVREKDALKKFLEKFLQDERGKWVKTFQDEFFEMIFKMRGWTWHFAGTKRPGVVGKYINDLVYSRIGPKVLEELKDRATDADTGKKSHYHRYLTPNYGHPALKEHIASLIALGRASGYDWNIFKKMVNKAFPKFGDSLSLDFPDSNSD